MRVEQVRVGPSPTSICSEHAWWRQGAGSENRVRLSEMHVVKDMGQLTDLLLDCFTKNLEGIMIKSVDSIYEPAARPLTVAAVPCWWWQHRLLNDLAAAAGCCSQLALDLL